MTKLNFMERLIKMNEKEFSSYIYENARKLSNVDEGFYVEIKGAYETIKYKPSQVVDCIELLKVTTVKDILNKLEDILNKYNIQELRDIERLNKKAYINFVEDLNNSNCGEEIKKYFLVEYKYKLIRQFQVVKSMKKLMNKLKTFGFKVKENNKYVNVYLDDKFMTTIDFDTISRRMVTSDEYKSLPREFRVKIEILVICTIDELSEKDFRLIAMDQRRG